MPLAKLDYLNLDFQLVEEEVKTFDGYVNINGKNCIATEFEWRPAVFSHKIAEAIEDELAEKLDLRSFKHPTAVTNEALSVLSTVNKPETGFKELSMHFEKLDEKIGPTVVDQFANQCH